MLSERATMNPDLVTIQFPDRESEKRALVLLIERRFFGRVIRGGRHYVPPAALALLEENCIPFELGHDARGSD